MSKNTKLYRIERDSLQSRVEDLVAENGRLKEDIKAAEQKGYHRGVEEAITSAPKQIITEHHLKQEYRKGFEAGRLKGKRERPDTPDGYESYENLLYTRNTWANRAKYAEDELRRLKAVVSKAVGLIIEGTT